jgi:hypothetical protein
LPIISPTGALLGAIACSTGTSLQDEDAALAGRNAVLALIQLEREEQERRIEEEREEVLRLWKEKEGEVEELRGLLEEERDVERDGWEGGGGKRRKTSGVGEAPVTPPEEGELQSCFLTPSFVGEVRVVGF